MNTEELLKPRYKVIADYPHMGKDDWKVGDILDRDWGYYGDDVRGFKYHVSNFPHLFRKLEWWEEREESDMPKYVKSIMLKHIFCINQWLFDEDGDIYFDSSDNKKFSAYPHNYLPATEGEYLAAKSDTVQEGDATMPIDNQKSGQ